MASETARSATNASGIPTIVTQMATSAATPTIDPRRAPRTSCIGRDATSTFNVFDPLGEQREEHGTEDEHQRRLLMELARPAHWK